MPASAEKLMDRTAWREFGLARSGGRCVRCGDPATEVHHVIERRLWPDGGYYESNGVAVCPDCHLDAERTIVSPDELRAMAGITAVVLPDGLLAEDHPDKWANPTLPNGRRLRGPLFYDESVQKVLREGGVLDLFDNRVKYPRTPHAPWSPGASADDIRVVDLAAFEGQRTVVTAKMDGEGMTTYWTGECHARSVDGRSRPDQSWMRSFAARFGPELPEGWRVSGEYLYARHSLAYDDLPDYFLGFSIWNDRNECLAWDDTVEWFELLGITPVEVLFDGIYDEKALRDLASSLDTTKVEGYVCRLADSFSYGNFARSVFKVVRPGHVTTASHWTTQEIVPNKLRST